MIAIEIVHRLRERHSLAEGWITMSEVTPPKTSRRFDLIAIMGWSSRGHEAMGFEVKMSRQDWLNELKNPAKADPLVNLCSRYWIVAPPGVVEEAEVPPAWGLLTAHPEQFRAARQAPRLECDPWSDAVWRCMLLRLATRESRSPDELNMARSAGRAEGREAGEKALREFQDESLAELKKLRSIISKAQDATGVALSEWTDYAALGQAMRLISGQGHHRLASDLDRHAEQLEHAVELLKSVATAVKVKTAEGIPK